MRQVLSKKAIISVRMPLEENQGAFLSPKNPKRVKSVGAHALGPEIGAIFDAKN